MFDTDPGTVVRALGGDPTSHSHDKRYPCPLCGGKRHVAVEDSNSKTLVYCHSDRGCDVWGWLKEQGVFVESTNTGPTEAERMAAGEMEEAKFEHRARMLYQLSHLPDRKRPEAYLKSRGITLPMKSGILVPANTFGNGVFYGKYPSAVFPIVNGDRLLGLHVISLNRKADGKLAVKKGKSAKHSYKFLDTMKGGYIPLGRPDSEKPLIVAEGVETALSASQITGGLPAIAALGTSGMKTLVNIPACSEVIIARDLGKGGRDAAEKLAKRLARQHKVSIARPPGKRNKKTKKWSDWNDALQSGQDLKELKRKILKAPVVKAPENGDALTMAEFIELDVPQLTYLVNPILVMPGMTMLHARSGHGKTRLALSLAYAYATGEPLMDWTIAEPGKALYIDAELSPENMKEWLARLGPPTDNLRVISDKWNYRVDKPRVSLATEKDRDYLTEQIKLYDPKLIILDSLFVLVPPEMAQGKVTEDKWSDIIEWNRNLKRQDRHVVLLHHDNKGGSQFGSSIKEIEFDLMMQLKVRKDHNTPGKWAFELAFSKPRHLSSEDAEPRIITATDKGIIEWERTDQSVTTRQAKAQKNREMVAALSEAGLSATEIAKSIGLSDRQVRNIKKSERSEG